MKKNGGETICYGRVRVPWSSWWCPCVLNLVCGGLQMPIVLLWLTYEIEGILSEFSCGTDYYYDSTSS